MSADNLITFHGIDETTSKLQKYAEKIEQLECELEEERKKSQQIQQEALDEASRLTTIELESLKLDIGIDRNSLPVWIDKVEELLLALSLQAQARSLLQKTKQQNLNEIKQLKRQLAFYKEFSDNDAPSFSKNGNLPPSKTKKKSSAAVQVNLLQEEENPLVAENEQLKSALSISSQECQRLSTALESERKAKLHSSESALLQKEEDLVSLRKELENANKKNILLVRKVKHLQKHQNNRPHSASTRSHVERLEDEISLLTTLHESVQMQRLRNTLGATERGRDNYKREAEALHAQMNTHHSNPHQSSTPSSSVLGASLLDSTPSFSKQFNSPHPHHPSGQPNSVLYSSPFHEQSASFQPTSSKLGQSDAQLYKFTKKLKKEMLYDNI